MTDWRTVFEDVDVVSFDIYDTLVLRPFIRPTDLFLYIEITENNEGFHKARIQAEKDARRVIDKEANIDEIYSLLDTKYQHLKDLEIRTEISFSVPNKTIVEAFDVAKTMGKKVILVTDMYLPRDVLITVLEHCDIDRYDGLYISSESRCNKKSGGLFDLVLKDLSITPDRMLHIGDNRYSDDRIPNSKGIRTLRVDSPIDSYLRDNREVRRFVSKNGLSGSIIAATDMLLMDNVKEKDDWYSIGYRYGGPLIKAYVDHLLNEIPKDSKILFIARDGYNLHRLFKEHFDYDVDYVLGQRLIYYVVSDEIVPFGKYELPSKITQRYKRLKVVSDAKYLLGFFKEKLRIGELPIDENELISLYNERYPEIDQMRRMTLEQYSSLLKKYATSDVHIVDCTTMRFSSQNLIELVLNKKVKGHYFVNLAEDNDLEYEGFGHRTIPIAGWMKINIPEFFFCSPEKPLIGWDEKGPVFSNKDTESERVANYDSISDGIMDYYRDMTQLLPELKIIQYNTVVDWSMIVSNKNNQYYKKMSSIRWSDTPNHKDWHHLIVTFQDSPYLVKRIIMEIIHNINKK